MGGLEEASGGGGIKGASVGVEARLTRKYPETLRSNTFELGGCRQWSEKLPMCLVSMDNNSQKQSLTRSSEFPYIYILCTWAPYAS